MSADEEIPFYLMPVAAILGIFAAFASLRLLYLMVSAMRKQPSASPYTPSTPRSAYILLIISIALSVLGYAKVVAKVNNAMEASSHAHFDPYELLEISTNANATDIKQAYRNLSKTHHPDKGGSPQKFQNIHLAYRALTDETSIRNYQQYGHPEGPPSTQSMAFALPEWLLHPQGNVVFVLLFLYLGMFVTIIYAAIRFLKNNDTTAATLSVDGNSVAQQDTLYLASHLSPTTSHLDVLYWIATTPENIAISEKALAKIDSLKQQRLEEASKKQKKEPDFDMDDGGWADDEDEDEKEAAKKAKQLEEELEKERLSLKKAQGTDTVLLEGVDSGVLGQAWVESILKSEGKWPPQDLGCLQDQTFAYNGKQVTALEHPAVRRNLLMTYGRLNSDFLNQHTDLLEATSKGLIDQTYFMATAEFRKRASLLLDASLRMAVALKSYRLAKTIVETITMFKIGTVPPLAPESISKFESAVQRTYNCLPRMVLSDLQVFTDDEDEIATNDTVTLQMDIERPHAETFTKQKLAMFQKQGIPPQVAMQAIRENWFVLVRAEKLDDGAPASLDYDPVNEKMKELLNNVDVETFKAEEHENRLVTAWPLVVQNCAQSKGKIKLQFKAPAVPGKYRFHIAVMSQDFLGADQEVTCERKIIDEASVKKTDGNEEEHEGKKDK